MQPKDKRKAYILGIVKSIVGPESSSYFPEELYSLSQVDSFLNEDSVTLLQILIEGNNITASTNWKPRPANSFEIQFIKTQPQLITELSIQDQVVVSFTRQDPIAVLLQSLNSIYLPSSQDSNELASQLKELTSALSRSIHKDRAAKIKSIGDLEDFKDILRLEDEARFWQALAQEAQKHKLEGNRQDIQRVSNIITNISRYFRESEEMEISRISEALERTGNAVNELWVECKIYSEDRMKHLFELISEVVQCRIQNEFKNTDFWTGKFNDVRIKLNECLKSLAAWLRRIGEFTQKSWVESSHKWSSGLWKDPSLLQFKRRLNELFVFRSQHDELLRLFSPKEQESLGIEELFNPFRSINALHCSSAFNKEEWAEAQNMYMENIKKIESTIFTKLTIEIFGKKLSQADLVDIFKKKIPLSDLSAEKLNPTQLLREFRRWYGLMSLENVKAGFLAVRRAILENLIDEATKLNKEFTAKKPEEETDEDSKCMERIIWVRQLLSKLHGNYRVAQKLLADLDELRSYIELVEKLTGAMKAYEVEQYAAWIEEIKSLMESTDSSLGIKVGGQFMKMNAQEDKVDITYSVKLPSLLKDIRQLKELDFKIPAEIEKLAEEVKKRYQQAVTLKQLADYYNSIHFQVIPSQLPMLKELRLEFKETVKSSEFKQGGTWKNAKFLEQYIERVKAGAEALMQENRKLKRIHEMIGDLLAELFTADLVKNKQKWKNIMEKIKATIEGVCKDRNKQNVEDWIVHWDYQIYKILQHQYVAGLHSLSEILPAFDIEVIVNNKQIGFSPSLEELKMNYYGEIKSFIEIPNTFEGISGNTEIFKTMIDANASSLQTIYTKAEELFAKLKQILIELEGWVVLGQIDIEGFIEKNFTSVEHWSDNLKTMTSKRRELERMDDSRKIECFNVFLEPFKQTIDDLLQRYINILLRTLKSSIKTGRDTLDQFLEKSMSKLGTKPQTVSEVNNARTAVLEINQQKRQYMKSYEECQEKNKLLRQVGGQNVNISDLESRWHNLGIALNAYSSTIEQQKEMIKVEIGNRIIALEADIEKFYSRWKTLKPKKVDQMDQVAAIEMARKMKEWKEEWDILEKRVQEVRSDSKHFEMPDPKFKYYKKIVEELVEQDKAWQLHDQYDKELSTMTKEDWLSFRSKVGVFQDFISSWMDKLKPEEQSVVTNYIKEELEKFRQGWPMLKVVAGEVFEKEHWKILFVYLKLDKSITIETLTFGDIIRAMPLILEKAAEIKELHARAQGEVGIREAIHDLKLWCETAEFSLLDHIQDGRTTPLIKDWKEITSQVSDKQALMLNLKELRFYSRFEDQVGQFESKLSDVDEYLQKLNVIQRKWVYLEPILGRGALPQEQGRFKRVDEEYRSIMLNIGANPRVLNLCSIPGLKDSLDMISDQLDRCQKALNDFLEEKRSRFSRFYFIGDDDLLEILGQSKNPMVIQNHLKKLFAGIHTVEFNKDTTAIVAMKSSLGEYVPLNVQVNIQGEVETWLNDLANGMKQTLQKLLIKALAESPLNIEKNPSQINCLSELIHFTETTDSSISNGRLSSYKQELTKKLDLYIIYNSVGNLLLQQKIKALVLDIIHNIDVLDLLIKNNVHLPSAWTWYKQLKFRIKDDVCKILMCSANFLYTYEYQGNAQKLVHTPLTDKCYLTLTQGMRMGYGGNPYGPAGTGKTESVKALGQAFGRQVLVFNCDEGIDSQSMERIFVGLIKCGAWGCFDEFNRLLEKQLSAISQQIQLIQWALKEHSPRMTLLGKTIDVNHNAGIFVTMNPAGKGYGGRSKLPDNLKQLFRPVAMSVPDNELIAEILLFAEGFKNAKKLAQKIVSLFLLCKQLLSYQQHYDWGLRALKTILTVGGELIQEAKRSSSPIDSKIEAGILIKAIRINTLSKLTFADSNKFLGLMNDMFPDIVSEDIAYEEVANAIRIACEELKLEHTAGLTKKMLELHEALRQRMGVVLVGPSGCGKTTIWKVLKTAYEKLGSKVVAHIMNPKAMDKTLLLGNMDHDTREWTDGVLTASARQVVKEQGNVKCWIICDGDIDPEWVESLNSVLDDNHLLTLPSGERINFGPNVNFLFETDNLKYASPATVSRMGVIYMCDEDIDVSRLVNSWLKKQDSKIRDKIGGWINEYFGKGLELLLSRYWESIVIATTRVGIVSNVLSLLSGVHSKSQFALSFVWGFSSNLKLEARNEFARELFDILGEQPIDKDNPLDMYCNTSFKPYKFEKTELFPEGSTINIGEPPFVRTIGAQRDVSIIEKWVESNEPFILVGPEGCGKSLLLRYAFAKLKSTQIATIHCNAETTSRHLMQKLKQMCNQSGSSQGKVYRPKDALKLIIVLKDINLPQANKYENIQLISFIQQIISYNGFYDEDLEFVYLERIQFIASMNPASTIGRHILTCRFTAIVRILYIDYPSDKELMQIYKEYFEYVLSKPNIGKGELVMAMSQFVVEFLKEVKRQFSIDEYRHYLFTPREVTQWCFGLSRYTMKNDQDFVRGLIWEANRIFRDRLVAYKSVVKFDNIIVGRLKDILKIEIDPKVMKDVYFAGEKGKNNMQIYTKSEFIAMVEQAIRNYERENKEINLHLISEVLELIAAEDRILSTTGGSILLAGVSGVGRRTCTQLAAYMQNLEYISPKIGREYTIKEFSKDLKAIFQQIIQDNKQILLFIEDHQLTNPLFMQYLNSLISSWEIPGLYSTEELDQLLAGLQEEYKMQYKYRHVFEYFKAKIKEKLRIVLSLDYTHPLFLKYCANNPALYSKCGIIWRQQWSKNSMVNLCARELDDLLVKMENKEDKIELFKKTMAVHNACVKIGATPLKYFHLLANYRKIYGLKINSQGDQSKRLESGLSKLSEAENLVEKLLNEVSKNKAELSQKQVEANNAMQDITSAMGTASERKIEVEELQKVLKVEEERIIRKKRDIDERLSDIMPEVEKAQKDVGELREDNLREIKSFAMPPDAVRDVLSCVMILMGSYNTTWKAMKIFLGQSGIIKHIVTYDARQITPKTRKDIIKLMTDNADSFDPKSIARASVATAPLAAWVKAMIKFSEALEKVNPLEAEKTQIEGRIVQSQKQLKKCEEEATMLSEQVIKLQKKYENCTREAARLEESLRVAQEKLESAQNLINKLSGEKNRWADRQQSIETEVSLIPITALLAGGFITYLGGENESKRAEILAEWRNLLQVPQFNFSTFMCNESELLKWKGEGLPADSLSVENAIILLNSTNIPLIIDSSMQATEWLKSHLKETGTTVEVLNQQDPKFVTQLELAIRFGKTLIVQENDHLEGMMFPILRKDLIHQGPRWIVNIGEKQIDYTESFALYLCTRDPYIEIPPNGLSKISVVNFTVTKSGLEGQLLSITLNHEQPELEQKKNMLLEEEEKLRIQLADLEDKLLTELVSSGKENILENKGLVESLNETKAKSMTIEESIQSSRQLQTSLDEQRAVYKPFAEIGSIIFMVISDLQKLNNMYQFSLLSFINLFKKTLDTRPNVSSMKEKLALLSKTLIKLTFYNIGRSLLKADRLMFGLYFVKGIYPHLIGENEWEFFIGTVVASEAPSMSLPRWANADRKEIFELFAGTFPKLVTTANLDNEGLWKTWSESSQCEREFPSQMVSKLSQFQRLLLVQVFRPDRLESAMGTFVCEVLNEDDVSPPAVPLKKMYEEETLCTEPILFITGPGSDPSKELQEFAEVQVGRDKYHELAMGGGQNELVIKMVKQAAKDGDWVCLKNLHLVTYWLPTLEKELKALKPHNNFRIWLTTEPHSKFPAILLQSSLKIAYESPPGVKKNLQRTLQIFSGSAPSGARSAYNQILFLLAWLHAIIQERRTYIPQGWTKFYEFSYGDLRAAEGILKELLEDSKEIPYETIYGLLENAVYGGRIDNEFDIKVFRCYLRSIFNSEVISGSRRLSNMIQVPKGDIRDMMSVISKLSDVDSPEIFGLPMNIDRSVQRFNSQKILLALKQLQSISSEDLKFNKEKWTEQLGPLLKLWESLIRVEDISKYKIKVSLVLIFLGTTNEFTRSYRKLYLYGVSQYAAINGKN